MDSHGQFEEEDRASPLSGARAPAPRPPALHLPPPTPPARSQRERERERERERCAQSSAHTQAQRHTGSTVTPPTRASGAALSPHTHKGQCLPPGAQKKGSASLSARGALPLAKRQWVRLPLFPLHALARGSLSRPPTPKSHIEKGQTTVPLFSKGAPPLSRCKRQPEPLPLAGFFVCSVRVSHLSFLTPVFVPWFLSAFFGLHPSRSTALWSSAFICAWRGSHCRSGGTAPPLPMLDKLGGLGRSGAVEEMPSLEERPRRPRSFFRATSFSSSPRIRRTPPSLHSLSTGTKDAVPPSRSTAPPNPERVLRCF